MSSGHSKIDTQGVQPSGRAAAAGLRSGDVVSQVDGKPAQTVETFKAALSTGDRPALLLVHRGGITVFVTIERK